MAERHRELVGRLLDRYGTTYAEQAGVRLQDRPAPLYQLLVLCVLLSTRIRADVAVAAARELFTAGFTTAQKMADAPRRERVDALGRGHYKRYDERTATMLGKDADLLLERYRGDLRRMRDEAGEDVTELRRRLKEVPGDVGADIFCREAQAIWGWLRPFADRRVREGAERLDLPTDPAELAGLVRGEDFARLAAALVRVALNAELAEEVRAAA